ncbi:MAG: hypothetical protein L3J50_08675, partial [Emcibacter sp.]|nr:hypothetical protein [Emcibacter sp.]
MKIALASLNPTVGDLSGNFDKILAARETARQNDADLVVYSELCLIGYPPEDIVLKGAFQKAAMDKVTELAALSADDGPAMLIGTCWREGAQLYNSAILLDKGKIAAIRHKVDLPNYGVFDEKRLFAAGPCPGAVSFRGFKLGIMTCEDMWSPRVAKGLMTDGADILMVLNGSPYEMDKTGRRESLAQERVRETGLPLVYVNQV